MRGRIDELIVATGNPHKVQEIAQVLAGVPVRVLSLKDVPGGDAIPEPVEDGVTFEENARLKAMHYARGLNLREGQACLADDSGLEVDALGGAPGVYSARYAGKGDTREERDRANNEKLLIALRTVPREERTARFVCAVCVVGSLHSPPTRGRGEGEGLRVLYETRGEFPGVIGEAPRGGNGFGYDPLLVLPDGRTS
ncbi:MAG: non-canonical purine NTP pyrophosphatase, partial [Phycisphaerales bacterium]